MKNFIKIGFGCLFLLTLMVSCKSAKPSVNETINTTHIITETLHDTIFKIEKDSSFYRAFLECQNGKVVVKEVTQAEPGRKLKSPKVRIVNNELKVDCEKQIEHLKAQLKNKVETNTYLKTITKTKYINKLTWWQQTQIYGFRVLAFLLLLWLGWKYYKFKT